MNNSKKALITGATSGIGNVIAKHLAKKGYGLIILGRSTEKLDALSNELKSINSNITLDTILCDLSSYQSTKDACAEVRNSHEVIDIILLNAGLWNFQWTETADQIEETLQVNLLASIFIFNELKNLIPTTGESKVIMTSSGLHQGTINFEDIEFRNKFSGFKSYRQSKLGLLILTRWLAIQNEYKGISFYSVHPGMVNTELGRSAGWLSRSIFKLFGKSPKKGAETHIHLIDTQNSQLSSGEYYANSKITKSTSYSHNMEEAEKLWNTIEEYREKLEKTLKIN